MTFTQVGNLPSSICDDLNGESENITHQYDKKMDLSSRSDGVGVGVEW